MIYAPGQPYPIELRSAGQLELIAAYLLIMSFLSTAVIIIAVFAYQSEAQHLLHQLIP